MIRYVDTSLLVAALTNETKTHDAQAWLGKQKPELLAVSDLVITEFSSALAIKLRTNQIQADERAIALAEFARLTNDSLTVLSLNPPHFRTAARFADLHELGLRAGDALHLAVAAEHGATVCTLDGRLASAGPAIGVRTVLL